jgi:hypothetical protein
MRQQLVRSIRCAAFAAGLLLSLLVAGPATATAQTSGYRIVAGEISYNGSATLSCDYPDGSCTDYDGGYRQSSMLTAHGTAAQFAVHAPGEASASEAFAPLAIKSWQHDYSMTRDYSQAACGGPFTSTTTDSDLTHDGGTSPSVFQVGVRITPAAAANEFGISLLPPEATEPRFGWVWPTGMRWDDSTRDSTVLETTSNSGHSDCVGGFSGRQSVNVRAPFDFYPAAPHTLQETQPTYDPAVCDATGTCVVRVRGSTSWTYGSSYGGDDLSGSMAINWWLDVEIEDVVTLTSAVDPAEHGTLSGCRSTCASQYRRGATVTLAVTPDPGWRLAHWTGACAGVQQPTCSVTIDTDEQAGVVLEEVTECANLIDDDLDGTADFGTDAQCIERTDDDECGTLLASHVRGGRPKWRAKDSLAGFSNYDAMCAATWVPHVDRRFVPQGLALRGGSALISGYTCHLADSGDGCKKESKKTKPNTERCRLMSVQLSTGRVTADHHFSRQQCKHGGGVAVDPHGHIWIADTKKLVFLKGIHDKKPRTLKLASPVQAAFLTENPSGQIELGDWADKTEKDEPRLWTFSWRMLHDRLADRKALVQKNNSVTIPRDAQGAAYRPGGGLWVARSTSTWGKLTRPRTRTTPAKSLEFGPGVEEIEFAADGSLWAVFEAGSKRFPGPKKPFFPVIARFDFDALK